MMGLAASPGTEVEPMCSTPGASRSERRADPPLVSGVVLGPCRVVVEEHELPLLHAADDLGRRHVGSS